MSKFSCHIRATILALLVLCLPGSLMAGPIIISINDVPNAQPVIQVKDAPNGYEIITGEIVSTPGIEDGALIVLFGVNNLAGPNPLPDWGGRFVDSRPWQSLPPLYFPPDPTNYRQYRTGVDIVWIEHNLYVEPGAPHYGDLIVGFNSAFPGTWYWNPELVGDDNLGPVTSNWVTVYADDTVIIRFKPHTYVATGVGKK